MKNFKKVLALVLAFSMVLSTMTAFAAEAKYSAEAEDLHELGLFAGVDQDKFVPALETDLTREMAMKLIVDMMGWEVDEDATSDFEDVASWAQPYVAVAVEEGITNGTDNGFGGTRVASMHELITWYLRALGYDSSEAWSNAAALAMEAGLVTAADLMGFDKEVKRDDYVGIGYRALTVTKVGSDATLIEELVEAGRVDEDTAIELGLIKYEPATFEVVDANAEYLVKTVIEFNKEVKDSALSNAKIKIDGDKINKDDMSLSDDGLVLTIAHDPVDNGKVAKVEIDNLKAETGEEIDDFEEELKYLDKEPAEIISAEAIGTYEFIVKFSEPIKDVDRAGFTIEDEDGRIVRVRDANLGSNDKLCDEVEVKVTKKITEGSYNINVNSKITDYAEIGVFGEVTVDVENDEDAPEIIGYEVINNTTIELEFNEYIRLNKTLNTIKTDDLIYHTNTSNVVSNVTVDGKKLKLEFNNKGNEIPNGTIYIFLCEDVLEDFWGNDIDDVKYEIEREADVEAPVVDEVKQNEKNQKEILVIFEKADLKKSSAEEEDNYKVINADGDEEKIRRVRMVSTGDLKDKAVIIGMTDELSGTYTVEIENVLDENNNKMEDEVFEVVMKDKDRESLPAEVKVYNAGNDDQVIVINFGFEVATDEEYSALELNKYTLYKNTSAPSTTPTWVHYMDLEDKEDDIEISLTSDDKGVEIYIPKSDTGIDLTGINTYGLEIARIADVTGNATFELAKIAKVVGDVSPIAVSEAKVIGENTIEVTFADRVEDLVLKDFNVKVDENGKISYHEVYSDEKTEFKKDGRTVVTMLVDYDFSSDVKYTPQFMVGQIDSQGNPIIDPDTSKAKVESSNGHDKFVEVKDTNLTDAYKPEIVTDACSTTTGAITIAFTEDVISSQPDDTFFALTFKLTLIDKDDEEIQAPVDYEVASTDTDKDGNYTVTFELLGTDYNNYEGDVLVELGSNNYITDKVGNELDEFDSFTIELER